MNEADKELSETPRHSGVIDFSQYAHPDKLGDGEARQKLRQLEDEHGPCPRKRWDWRKPNWTAPKRLFEKEFVTKTQLDNDQMAYNRKVIARESAETSHELFIKYEFPKQAQQLLSDYEESLRQTGAYPETGSVQNGASGSQTQFGRGTP